MRPSLLALYWNKAKRVGNTPLSEFFQKNSLVRFLVGLALNELAHGWLLWAGNPKREKGPKRAAAILPFHIWKIYNGLDFGLLAELIRIRESPFALIGAKCADFASAIHYFESEFFFNRQRLNACQPIIQFA